MHPVTTAERILTTFPRRVVAVVAVMLLGIAVAPAVAGAATRATAIHGIVGSGSGSAARPLGDARVTLVVATPSGARAVAETRTDARGRFTLSVPTRRAQRYLVARHGEHVVLVTLLGRASPSHVAINELTTVAAAYATAQLAKGTSISGTALQLTSAVGMAGNLVSPITGAPSAVITSAPNGNETNAWRALGTLANVLAPCVRDEGACSDVLSATRAGSRGTTWDAIRQIALHPARNLQRVFALGDRARVFRPYLTARFGPRAASKWTRLDAFTLAVKLNASGRTQGGAEVCPFGGVGNIAFDLDGNAWMTNNVVQGTPDSARCIIVLRPDGRPTDGRNGTPDSPVVGGGIVGQGFGLGFAPDGRLWSGNFGWGASSSWPTIDGTTPGGGVSVFDGAGNAISGPYGYPGAVYRVQGTVSDADGNIWMAGYGNSKVQVFPGGDPTSTSPVYADGNTEPFDIRLDADGDAWVSYTGTSTASKLRYTPSGIQRLVTVSTGTAGNPKGVAVDQAGNVWIASGANDAVYAFAADGTALGTFSGGGIDGPWGVTVDSSGSLWAANFGGITQVDTKYGVTRLCGFVAGSCPKGVKPGDPLTPSTGFTLPSGGAPVTLHSGEPLYGPKGPKTYKPLMRQTAAQVDAAGNLWVTNNWKPSGAIDTAGGNPGGDGIVVFLGVAAPVQPKLYNGPATAPGE